MLGYAPKKRRPWGALTAISVGVSAALGIISNLGDAREVVRSTTDPPRDGAACTTTLHYSVLRRDGEDYVMLSAL